MLAFGSLIHLHLFLPSPSTGSWILLASRSLFAPQSGWVLPHAELRHFVVGSNGQECDSRYFKEGHIFN